MSALVAPYRLSNDLPARSRALAAGVLELLLETTPFPGPLLAAVQRLIIQEGGEEAAAGGSQHLQLAHAALDSGRTSVQAPREVDVCMPVEGQCLLSVCNYWAAARGAADPLPTSAGAPPRKPQRSQQNDQASTWQPILLLRLVVQQVAASAEGAADGQAADAKATGDALLGARAAASQLVATLLPGEGMGHGSSNGKEKKKKKRRSELGPVPGLGTPCVDGLDETFAQLAGSLASAPVTTEHVRELVGGVCTALAQATASAASSSSAVASEQPGQGLAPGLQARARLAACLLQLLPSHGLALGSLGNEETVNAVVGALLSWLQAALSGTDGRSSMLATRERLWQLGVQPALVVAQLLQWRLQG